MSIVTATFDFQAIEHKKPVFYKRKFATFNFTVYKVVANKKGNCFVSDWKSKNQMDSNKISNRLTSTCLNFFSHF